MKNFCRTGRVWFYVVMVHIAVQCFGLAKVRAWLACKISSHLDRREHEYDPVEDMRHRIRIVKIRGPMGLRGNCLSRSLVLWWLLARANIATTLHIGAARRGDVFKAHSWVEHDGRPINAGRRVREKYHAFDHDFTAATLR